jgi:hypothetical protein
MILDNNTYNKIKLLHEISCIIWFLEKHALQDAQATGDTQLLTQLQQLKYELTQQLEKLQQAVCVIMQ